MRGAAGPAQAGVDQREAGDGQRREKNAERTTAVSAVKTGAGTEVTLFRPRREDSSE